MVKPFGVLSEKIPCVVGREILIDKCPLSASRSTEPIPFKGGFL